MPSEVLSLGLGQTLPLLAHDCRPPYNKAFSCELARMVSLFVEEGLRHLMFNQQDTAPWLHRVDSASEPQNKWDPLGCMRQPFGGLVEFLWWFLVVSYVQLNLPARVCEVPAPDGGTGFTVATMFETPRILLVMKEHYLLSISSGLLGHIT